VYDSLNICDFWHRNMATLVKWISRMFYIDGLSTTEIADALGISGGACRTRLHRLREKIYAKIREAMGN